MRLRPRPDSAEADPDDEAPVGTRQRRRALPLALKATAGLVLAAILYVSFGFFQVWAAARQDHARKAQAIVVFGAAQYQGRPSPVLAARLDHALDLYEQGFAPKVVVTGGRLEGDRFTEASVSADYLIARGVPDSAILREVSGRSSWQSLAAASSFLADRGIDDVLLVSDPFHSYRIKAMAGELDLRAATSPTRTSPIVGFTAMRFMAREAVAVAVGRIVGYSRQARIDGAVRGDA